MCYDGDMAIPSSAHFLFWDIDIDKLDLERYRHFVIERVLEHGTNSDATWIFMQYPTSVIADIAQTSRRLSEKSRNYWGLKLGLWNHPISMQSVKKPATIWKY